MQVRMEEIAFAYSPAKGEEAQVLKNVTLQLQEGEFVSIIGPSGCGKSTLFNLLAGLETPQQGRIYIEDRDVTGKPGYVGYMMQSDALFPWRTVLENATLTARVEGHSPKEARKEARRLLPAFGLEGYGDDPPARLSGGMRQRAALLRTVMSKRKIWLLDEPLGALDALTRERMQDWILSIHQQFPRTVLLITHSIEEAVYLSDRVIILSHRPAKIIGTVDIPFAKKRTPQLRRKEAFFTLCDLIRNKLEMEPS